MFSQNIHGIKRDILYQHTQTQGNVKEDLIYIKEIAPKSQQWFSFHYAPSQQTFLL